MESKDLVYISDQILDDVKTIVHNQQVLAGVHAELDKNKLRLFEQDYIYQEHYGKPPSEPQRIEHNGVIITKRVLHQTGIGLKDINGADLLYEVEGEKFGLIQYKRANNKSVKSDSEQLHGLLSNCPKKCFINKSRTIPKNWLPLKTNSFCGAWYCVIDDNGEQRFIHACEAESIFQANQSVQSKEFEFGMTRGTFLELFSSCRIGSLISQPNGEEIKSLYLANAIESNHLVYEIVQKGKWLAK